MTRFDRGSEAVFFITILNLFREFDDQDGVLASESDQDNKTNLSKDVVLHRAQPDTVDRAEQAHRDDENDRERERPAFVKGGEQEKNEQNAERENINRAVAGERLLERDLRPFGGETGGQNLFGETFDRCQRVTGARAGRRLAAEVGRSEHVVAGDLVGAAHLLHSRNRTERNNSTRIVARL